MKDEKFKESGRMLLEFLRQIAREKGLIDQDIADKTGFIRSNVNRMLSGRYMPELDNFLRLAESIGVRLELHSDQEVSQVKTRNIDVPRFLFAPDASEKELYVMHTHYPACLIKVIQTSPMSFIVVESYDAVADYNEVLSLAKEFLEKYYLKNIADLN